MAPRVKPGSRTRTSAVIKSDSEEAALQKQMKNMLTVSGFPKSIWHSVQFTTGVRKQAEVLRERIRQQAGGDEIEMQRLERELDLTEEELDMEAGHFDELASRLSPAQQTRLADTMRQIRALEDGRDTLAVDKERRIRLAEGDDYEDNTPPNEPADEERHEVGRIA